MSIATLPRIGSPAICNRCDQTVTKARTRLGKWILLDFHPTQLGKYVIVGEDQGHAVVAQVARHLSPDDARARYQCHWDHCRYGNTKPRRYYGRSEVNYSPFAR